MSRAALVAVLAVLLAACAGTGSAPAAPSPVTPAPAPRPGTFAVPPGATIVIDPGHDGGNARAAAAIARPVPDGRGSTKPCNTTGTATADGYAEHAFTRAVSGRLATLLRERGYRVVLTRPDDAGVGPCVDVRGRAGARERAAAVISVHADGAAAAGHGFHVLTSSPPLNAAQRAPSTALADATVGALRGAGFTPATYIGRDGLDPRDDIAGLNLATVPSVLVECANLRNPADAALARSPEGQERFARALASTIS